MTRSIARWIGMLFLMATLGACGTGFMPAEIDVGPGARQWIISVDNQSSKPARILVLEDLAPVPGDVAGNVEPSSVPANTTMEVVVTVPAGEGWAIFVNPTAERGPLILAGDVPKAFTGRLPLAIEISPDGEAGAWHVGDLGPGWFGE